MLRTMEHYVSQDDMCLRVRNQQALTRAAQVQTPLRKLFLPDTFATMQTFIAGGIRKTLNSSLGWWCSRVNLPLDRSWLRSFVRLTNSSPHTLHTQSGKKIIEKPSVHVVEPRRKARSVEPTRTCTAMTTASLKHHSLRWLREYHLLSQWTISIMCNLDGSNMSRRKSVTTTFRRCPQVKKRWILPWVHGNSAWSHKKMDSTLGTDLRIDRRTTSMLPC